MGTRVKRGRGGTARLLSMVAGAALVGSASLAAAPVASAAPNDLVNIPDETLLEIVNDALNEEDVDGVDNRSADDDVTEGEAAQLKEISHQAALNDPRVSDLTGLSHVTNLKKLELRFHHVTEVGELSGLQYLEFLRLTAASGTTEVMDGDTDFSALEHLPELKTLYLTFHGVSDVTGLASALKDQGGIEYLHLQDNGIVDVSPLAEVTSLRHLILGQNQVEDVDPLAALVNLRSLSLSENAIAEAEPLSPLDLGSFNYLYLNDQKVEMPDVDVGETTSNPVIGLNGSMVEVTSDDDLDLSNGFTSWSFATPGEKTIKWSIPNEYHPQGQDAYGDFSGTITQTVKERIATPDTPDITEPVCIDGAPTGPVLQYINTEGVTYDLDREQNADGSWTVTVTAEAEDGYVLEAPSGASNWTVDEDSGVATWVEEFDEATCGPEPVVVVPDVPEVDECVDGEPVVVHLLEGSEGVDYESEITDNGDGSYTVEVRAKADNSEGFTFNVDDLAEGWEHIGDGILIWPMTVTPECDTEDPDPSDPPVTEDPDPEDPSVPEDPDEPSVPELPETGVTVGGMGSAALAAIGLGGILLLLGVAGKRRFE